MVNECERGGSKLEFDTQLDHKQLSDLAESRKKIYNLLSSIFIKVPTLDFVNSLISHNFGSVLADLTLKTDNINGMLGGIEIVNEFLNASRSKSAEKLRQELAVVFTRLFRGITKGYSPLPPYESAYLEGRVMGNSTQAVMRRYAEANAKIFLSQKEKMPDSIELELGFMGFLCSKEIVAWRNENTIQILKYLEMEKAFLDEHMLQWIPKFSKEAERVCNEIGKEANFYLGVVRMVRDFTKFDHNLTSSIIHALNTN